MFEAEVINWITVAGLVEAIYLEKLPKLLKKIGLKKINQKNN